MILVGIDDTDMPGTPGTNQLARAIVSDLAERFTCQFIIRHQLFDDPRVPYTSKNGSASIWLRPSSPPFDLLSLIATIRLRMRQWFVPGSDPGLCVTERVTDAIVAFARRCQSEIVTREEAMRLANTASVHLEGLGGTCGGMIGALAAVGLASTGNDGRVVVRQGLPQETTGIQSIEWLHAVDVRVVDDTSGELITVGNVDVGRHLRPNLRNGKTTLYVRRDERLPEYHLPLWVAVRRL